MRVLVVDAGGFIGRALVAALADSGWAEPVAATRRPATWAAGVKVTLDARRGEAVGRRDGAGRRGGELRQRRR